MKKSISLLLLLFVSVHVKSQNSLYLGLNLNGGIIKEGTGRFGAEILFERPIKKIAIRTGVGIWYNTNLVSHLLVDSSLINPIYLKADITQYYLTIPLLIKAKIKWLDFSVGGNSDFYIGFSQSNNTPGYKIKSYESTPTTRFALTAKISKEFIFKDNYVIEPEVCISKYLNIETYYLGAGVNFKFNLKK